MKKYKWALGCSLVILIISITQILPPIGLLEIVTIIIGSILFGTIIGSILSFVFGILKK